MRDFIRKYQKAIGLLFIAVAVYIFADKAVDLGAEAMPLLGEVMLGIILFAVGYVFVVQSAGRKKAKNNMLDTEKSND